MPFYEYRPKSGSCAICQGCFVDLQKMSEAAHAACPDCGQACERVISVPMVSVRGADYRAESNKEKRAESYVRAAGENAKLREASSKKYEPKPGHNHNCALAGCYGEKAFRQASESSANISSPPDETHRFGGLPHLVGVAKKTTT